MPQLSLQQTSPAAHVCEPQGGPGAAPVFPASGAGAARASCAGTCCGLLLAQPTPPEAPMKSPTTSATRTGARKNLDIVAYMATSAALFPFVPRIVARPTPLHTRQFHNVDAAIRGDEHDPARLGVEAERPAGKEAGRGSETRAGHQLEAALGSSSDGE